MFVSAGVTSPQLIQQNVFSAIGGIMSLFCLGFGNDVDYSFLDVMCRQNKGVARRIFEGSDAAIQLKVRQEIKNINDCNMKINASVEMLVCALHLCLCCRVSTRKCPALCSWRWICVIQRIQTS